MRTHVILLVALFGFACSSQRAVRYEPVVPVNFQNPMMPLLILEHFARHCPDAIPFWGIEGKNYRLKYIDPSTALGHVIIYNSTGKILRNENEINFSDCPVNLQDYYLKNYPDEQLRIWTYEQDSDLRYYYLRRGSRTVWFDREGRYVRKKAI